jgi:hypothetical protein
VRTAGSGEPESPPSSIGAEAVLSTMRGPPVVVDASGGIVVDGCGDRFAAGGTVDAVDDVAGATIGAGAVVTVGVPSAVTGGRVGGTVVRRGAVVVVVVVTVAPEGSTPGLA